MKTHEMRAVAASKKAEAERLLKDMTDDETKLTSEGEARYDALIKEASDLLTKADAAEVREKRMNDLASRLDGANPTEQRRAESGPPLPHNDQRNSGTRHQYSLLKALFEQSEPGQRLSGLERETHDELQKRYGKASRGVMVPWDLPVNLHASEAFRAQHGLEKRTGTVDTTAGAGAVMTTTLPTMIELLRIIPLMPRLGARIMADLQGNIAVPRQSGGSSASWVTEGNAASASNATIDQVTLSPSTVTANTAYTRAFLRQTSVDAEMFLRTDLTLIMGIELDRVGFNGSGSGAEPEGIVPNSDVNIVAIGTNGGAPAWANLIEMETDIAAANALLGQVSFVVTPQGRGKMRTVTKVASSTFSDFLWDNGNTVLGTYPAYATNQLPHDLTKGSSGAVCSAAVLGNFNDALYGFWGGLDIIVDPYALATSGGVKITSLQDADFAVRHPLSFSVIKDMTTT